MHVLDEKEKKGKLTHKYETWGGGRGWSSPIVQRLQVVAGIYWWRVSLSFGASSHVHYA